MTRRWFPGLCWLVASVACRDPEVPPSVEPPPDDPPAVGEPALVFDGERPRNVLMISVDTTRRDVVGDYSSTMYTPFLASLMSTSVRLDDHQQCSNWTFASTSCTLNGRFHEENGFIPELGQGQSTALPPGQPTLARRLSEAGYHTILVSRNSWLGPEWNNDQGYDVVQGAPERGATSTLQTGAELAGAGGGPWFAHLHLMEPHEPYIPPMEYRGELDGLPPLPADWDLDTEDGHYALVADRWPDLTPAERELLVAHLLGRYHGELRYLDDQLAAAWPLLEASGLLEDTLVVFWTDHGEQFYERGNQAHAWNLGAEENDAVLFFWARNLRPLRWTEPTMAVDLLPTVLEAIGVEDDEPRSGLVLGTAPADRPRYSMSVARAGALQSVTIDGWKLVFEHEGRASLFDRATDRAEERDQYSPSHPQVQALWPLLLPRARLLHALQPDEAWVAPPGLSL